MPTSVLIGALLITEMMAVNASAQTGAFPEIDLSKTETMVVPQSNEVSLWRDAFRASGDKAGRIRFQTLMNEATEHRPSDPKAQAFLAVAELMVASKSINPFSKWIRFNKWTKVLDEQIQRSPRDADIRLIRLTIQANAPAFLGYSSETEEDCVEVGSALNEGFWSQDPEHEAFVSKTYNKEKPCH